MSLGTDAQYIERINPKMQFKNADGVRKIIFRFRSEPRTDGLMNDFIRRTMNNNLIIEVKNFLSNVCIFRVKAFENENLR